MSEATSQLLDDARKALQWLLNNIKQDAPQLSGKAMGNAERVVTAIDAALAQPAPSPQPAVPVVSDERMLAGAFANGVGYALSRNSDLACAKATKKACDESTRAILALRPQAVPMTDDGDFFVLDDEAKSIIVNSHHYTPDNIHALIEQLKAFSDPEKTTQSDWDNLDWRGFCNVLQRVMMGLACDLSPQAVPMTLEPTNDVGLVPVVIKPFTQAQRRRLWGNSPEIHEDAASIAGFERIVSLTERAHGITAKTEGPV